MVSWTQLRHGNVFEGRILLQVEMRVRHREVEDVLLQRGQTGRESREERRGDFVHRSEERD